MWTCNTMYIIDMPLWISSELGLPEQTGGFPDGTAAGLEIPAMILAGYYVKRYGKRRMMVIAVAAGVLFYTGLILFHSRLALMTLQLFNAVFIGIVAGIGMLWFQDLMPGRAGQLPPDSLNSILPGNSGWRYSGSNCTKLGALCCLLGNCGYFCYRIIFNRKG